MIITRLQARPMAEQHRFSSAVWLYADRAPAMGERTDDADGNRRQYRLYEGNSRVFWRLMPVLREVRIGYSKRMAISNLSNIESMLAQMREVARAASGAQVRASEPMEAPGGFAAELQRSLERVSSMQHSATQQAKGFILGDPDISLNNVMIDMQKASIAFQATVQVRNRLVAAYQEVASMPV